MSFTLSQSEPPRNRLGVDRSHSEAATWLAQNLVFRARSQDFLHEKCQELNDGKYSAEPAKMESSMMCENYL